MKVVSKHDIIKFLCDREQIVIKPLDYRNEGGPVIVFSPPCSFEDKEIRVIGDDKLDALTKATAKWLKSQQDD